MEYLIIPAIIAQSQKELDERLNRVRNQASLFQLDIMDGKFVPNHSLDFDFQLPVNMRFEAHLMINNPEAWISAYHHKVETILIHIESCPTPGDLIKKYRRQRKIGLVLNPETPLSAIQEFLNDIDQVLIMTVNPGFYGSPFLPETLDKVRNLRQLKPNLNIEVDGGITPDTINAARQAGANLFVSGSYIVKAPDVALAMKTLEDIIKH